VAECLFCAIVAGEIPATTVLETDRILAFRDINPQAPTHVPVIPKTHYPDLAALAAADAALLGEVIGVVQQVAAADAVAETGYRVVFNTGAEAGQAVPHVHGHLLGGRFLSWPPDDRPRAGPRLAPDACDPG
jgi:histidine triad (HIT) family protein